MGTVISGTCRDYREGAARLQLGPGFFRPGSRPARDLLVLLCAGLAGERPPALLDLMAGCGIRSLRCGLEVPLGLRAVWANDADPDRLPLLRRNLAPLQRRLPRSGGDGLRCSALPAEDLLALCRLRRRRFDLVDLDGFGSVAHLVPAALEAVRFGGVLMLTSSDGRSPTGHDRPTAVRRLGAAARAHPASWEIALRLQLAVLARSAWAMGRGITPLLSFSDGRTFRTAVRLGRRSAPADARHLGLLARCDRCGDQLLQPLLTLAAWRPCRCPAGTGHLAISGPLWLGPLQEAPVVRGLLGRAAAGSVPVARATVRLLERLAEDDGTPPLCWSTAELGRRLGAGPPTLPDLVAALRARGHRAGRSGVMAGQCRTDAPWSTILAVAGELAAAPGSLMEPPASPDPWPQRSSARPPCSGS